MAEPEGPARCGLLRFNPALLTIALASESFLCPLLLTGLQVERMPLDFLNDVFLLHLALEPAKGAFQRFTVLHNDFCQNLIHLALA